MKCCNKCNQEKELSEFWKDKRMLDGTIATCGTCMRAIRKATNQHAIISDSTDVLRVCKSCGEPKPLNEFATSPANALGRSWHCKKCDCITKTALYHKKIVTKDGWISTLLSRVKHRAKEKGFQFDLTTQDILDVWTDTCPVFGVPLERKGLYAPSLDRIDSSKGYVVGNVVVMSNRANILKRDAELPELKALVTWWSNLKPSDKYITITENTENETTRDYRRVEARTRRDR